MTLTWTGTPTNLKADNNNYLLFQNGKDEWKLMDPIFLKWGTYKTADEAKKKAQEIHDNKGTGKRWGE